MVNPPPALFEAARFLTRALGIFPWVKLGVTIGSSGHRVILDFRLRPSEMGDLPRHSSLATAFAICEVGKLIHLFT
jgi:hypothetical protein